MQLPLNVSPVSASFFGLQRLGIHLVLSLACALLVLLHFFHSAFHTPHLTYPHVTSCNTLPLPLFQRHTLAFLCFSLSSCLGNIEVIVIYFCNAVVNVHSQEPLTPEKWKPASCWQTHPVSSTTLLPRVPLLTERFDLGMALPCLSEDAAEKKHSSLERR